MVPALSVAPTFESDVIPDSGKTAVLTSADTEWFESDVIPDSGKTISFHSSSVALV